MQHKTANPGWHVGMIAFSLLALGCVGSEEDVAGSSEEALTVAVGEGGVAYDFARVSTPARGVAGDERVVFVGEPLAGRVDVLDRRSGELIAELPPPEGGFRLVFGPKLIEPGRLLVLDAGGFPVFGVRAVPRVFTYRYWSDRTGFHAEIVRTDDFTEAFDDAGLAAAFCSDLAVLPDDGYLLTEQITGSFWRVTPGGEIVPAVVPRSAAPADALAPLAGCQFPPGTVVDFAGVPFSFFFDFAPGANYLATNGDDVFWENPCQQTIFAMPLASLYDEREPWERAADARPISAATQTAEILGGMSFNTADRDDPLLYVTNPYDSEIISVDPCTGERRSVVRDPVLFNSPANLAFLPSRGGAPSSFIVASSQEHRLAAINSQLTEDVVQPPWIVTRVFLRPHHHGWHGPRHCR